VALKMQSWNYTRENLSLERERPFLPVQWGKEPHIDG
jgi:hypothetical protein